jgi:hypothetical protein
MKLRRITTGSATWNCRREVIVNQVEQMAEANAKPMQQVVCEQWT